MELDSRIIEGKTYLDCFDAEVAKGFIGKECYLSDGAASFANVDNLNKAVLIEVDDENIKPYTLENIRWRYSSNFILPCEWVKEKKKEPKYRPYTLTEFVNTYSLGDEVVMRSKNNPTVTHVLFIEYEEGKDDVRLGQCWYTFMILFNNYELYIDGEWKPFGVEE